MATARSLLVQQLADVGKKLAHAPHTKDVVLKNLKEATSLLSEMEQSPKESQMLDPLTHTLICPTYLKHKDKDVRLLTTTCLMEILRIVAPEAPFSDEELKEIFQLVISSFQHLDEIASPGFARRITILEILAKFRICMLMLDVECDELILEMFQTFFSVISERHPPAVLSAMQTIMILVLEESEEISQPLLETVLHNLVKKTKIVSPAAQRLAIGVVAHCGDKLEHYVQRFLTSVMLEGREVESVLQDDYHDIIYKIYQCAPQILISVIPNLTHVLVTDHVDIRLKAVRLLGRLFSLPNQHVAKEYRQLFGDFLKRFTDKAVEVRLTMVECATDCLIANPYGAEALELLNGFSDRLLDNDEKVRLHVMIAIFNFAKNNLKSVPLPIIQQAADRLRDKKIFVRKATLQKLVDVYRTYCMKCNEVCIEIDEQLEWIPSKIIRCCYDKEVKEFRPAGIEIIFTEELFPADLRVEEKAKHWILFYARFDEIDKKALIRILSQKQRLQGEMLEYLSCRQKIKSSVDATLQEENNQVSWNNLQHFFNSMSSLFMDGQLAEEGFQKLHVMKDNNIFNGLAQLLDPNTTYSHAQSVCDSLLKRVGKKHPQHDFMKELALRCSFKLFGKEHVKSIIQEVFSSKASGNKNSVMAGLSLLAEFAGFFPLVIEAVKDELVHLLMEDDGSVKERVAEILAKAGVSFRSQIGDDGSSIELTLQKLCLEGNRKQAKHAVNALAAINRDSGFKALSVLYARLVDSLKESNPYLPTVFQSLSCIAQIAITIFETQEDEIIRFVVRRLLRKHTTSVIEEHDDLDADWGRRSGICSIKIFGLKALVKSFLLNKEHPRKRLMGLLGVLFTILPIGEISEDIKSSKIDKAHLRLAAAKGVLRLAQRLDSQIPPQIFQACILTAQDSCVHVRLQFLSKVHQYLRCHSLNHRYACAYPLYAIDSSKEAFTDAKHWLSDFVDTCYREARLLQTSVSGEMDASLIIHYPEYVLSYLVHVLAHHPAFPDAQAVDDANAFEPFYRMLLFYLRSLFQQEGDGSGKKDATDNLPAILAILRTVKKAEDAVKKMKTACLRTVCDIGISITKEIGRNKFYSESYCGVIPLPTLFYRTNGDKQATINKVDGYNLPSCLTDNVLSQFWSRCSRLGQMQSSTLHHKGVKRMAEEHLLSHAEVDREPMQNRKRVQDSIAVLKKAKLSHSQEVQHKMSTASIGQVGHRILRSMNDRNASLNGCITLKPNMAATPSRNVGLSRDTTRELSPSDKPKVQPRSIDEAQTLSETRTKCPESNGLERVAEPDVAGISQSNPAQDISLTIQRKVTKRGKVGRHIRQKTRQIVAAMPETNQKTLPEVFRRRSSRLQNTPIEHCNASSHGEDVKVGRASPAESPAWKSECKRTGNELVGFRIRVWSSSNQCFYEGVVQSFDPKKNQHKVVKDNGDMDYIRLTNEHWEIFSQESAGMSVPPGSSSNNIATAKHQLREKKMSTATCVTAGLHNAEISLDQEGSSLADNGSAIIPAVVFGGQVRQEDAIPLGVRNEREGTLGSTEAVNTGMRLRTRLIAKVQEGSMKAANKAITGSESTAGASDDEPTTTWRSRRRKVK